MPTSEVVISFGSSVVALLGGGGVVLAAICAFISKFIADRTVEGHKATLNAELERLKNELAKESELHKLKLRKAEILFERELEAVAEFGTLYRQIVPRYSHPDMDWDDACDNVASRFPTIEEQLENYLTKHAPVLTEALREKLRHCMTMASHNKFSEYEILEDQAAATSKAAAGRLLEELVDIENGLFALVRNETRA
ncbi:UNVERIFIED_ORG: hypothetical protein GGD59_006588 [Rhizobium esperanzae]